MRFGQRLSWKIKSPTLKRYYPSGGRPPDPLGDAVVHLASFMKEKTGKVDWKLIGDLLAKHIPLAMGDNRLWALNLARRYWQRRPKGPTNVEIILEAERY